MARYIPYFIVSSSMSSSYINFPSNNIIFDESNVLKSLEIIKIIGESSTNISDHELMIGLVEFVASIDHINCKSNLKTIMAPIKKIILGAYPLDGSRINTVCLCEIPPNYQEIMNEFITNFIGQADDFVDHLTNGKKIIELIGHEATVVNGSYYYPASEHYPNSKYGIVICDCCRGSNLESCIGYGTNCDLCFDCAKMITSKISSNQLLYNMLMFEYEKNVLKTVPAIGKSEDEIESYFKKFMTLEMIEPNVGYKNYVGMDYLCYIGTMVNGNKYQINIIIKPALELYYVDVTTVGFWGTGIKNAHRDFKLTIRL